SVEKWFGEIKASPAIEDLKPMPVALSETKKLYHLDNFAKLPQISLTFPTVEQYHKDSYALDALGYILSRGKQSPLFTTVVQQDKLAPSVNAYQSSNELAGTFTVSIRANANTDLDDVYDSIQRSMKKFENQGVRENDLIKIKAFQETSFYNGISSILSKAFQLGIYSEYAGDPAFIKQDIKNILNVSNDDVLRVYNKYIKGQDAIITSFVPKDAKNLIVDGSIQANIVEEEITQGKEKQFEEDSNPDFVKTNTVHDRSEPPLGELPQRSSPVIWHTQTKNSLNISGIELKEIPVINFNFRIKGGQLFDQADKQGTAHLLAEMMNEGTSTKTPAELEDAIGLLGSTININASKTAINIYGTTLKRNYHKTMEIVTDMVLNPRFDESDFDRLKNSKLTSIKASLANPNTVARNIIMKKIYGEQHILGQASGGTESSVNNIKLKDLKHYYKNYLTINQASIQIVGDYDKNQVVESLSKLDTHWHQTDELNDPVINKVVELNKPELYFVDFPDAKQSAIYVGKATLNSNHEDFNRLNIVNNRMGSGSSARLTQILRIEKGYTYGAYSRITPSVFDGTFIAATQVRSNVTLESLDIIKDQLSNYHNTFSEEELAITKNLIIKGNSRRYETLRQLMGILLTINQYGYADNYLELNQKELLDLTLEQAQKLIKSNLNAEHMIYVIVGDAKTQLDRVEDLGYGKPIVLDRLGNEIL
ncbi:MAG: M16 family metallopeptidase, partial [Marinicellaceae bacterium]